MNSKNPDLYEEALQLLGWTGGMLPMTDVQHCEVDAVAAALARKFNAGLQAAVGATEGLANEYSGSDTLLVAYLLASHRILLLRRPESP